jgi:hypothetical protein
MQVQKLTIISFSILLLSLLNGCGGPRGIRVTEGNQQVGSAPTGSVYATTAAIVVHVDGFERLATLRNAHKFPAGSFLETLDETGAQTAVLKARANRETGLRTADILEGEPHINDNARLVSATESMRLSKIYRDPIAE